MSWTDLTELNDLQAWYKADAIVGLSDTDPIGTWTDSSGNSNDLTQSGAARPTYDAVWQNGLPGVDFDGSSHWMKTAAASVDIEKASGMCVVVQADALGVYAMILAMHGAATPTWVPWGPSLIAYSDGKLLMSSGASPHRYNQPGAGTVATGTLYLLTFVRNIVFAEWVLRKNGAAITGVTQNTGAMHNAGLTYLFAANTGLGASFYLDGQLGEVVVWNSNTVASGNAEVDLIEGYLANKWGITLDAGHPFFGSAPTSGPTYAASGGLLRSAGMSGGFNG